MRLYDTCVYPNLRRALQESGMTREEVGEAIGISASNVWWWLTDGNKRTIKTIKLLLALTGLTFEEAFYKEGETL